MLGRAQQDQQQPFRQQHKGHEPEAADPCDDDNNVNRPA